MAFVLKLTRLRRPLGGAIEGGEEGDRFLHQRRMAGGVSRGSRETAEREGGDGSELRSCATIQLLCG